MSTDVAQRKCSAEAGEVEKTVMPLDTLSLSLWAAQNDFLPKNAVWKEEEVQF